VQVVVGEEIVLGQIDEIVESTPKTLDGLDGLAYLSRITEPSRERRFGVGFP
jgi:hypothetical protein